MEHHEYREDQAGIRNKEQLPGGSCEDSKIPKWLRVEARVAIRMELQGQQEFEKFCMEGDPGAENRMGFMGSNTIQK